METLLPALPNSPEFKLLLELSHPNSGTNQSRVVSDMQNPHFDCKEFLQMVEWHRLTPQVYQQLSPVKHDLPENFFSRLKAMNDRCRMASLKMSTWLARISRLLDANKIDFISMKGIALSQLIYGDSGYREVRDIDILVAPEDIDAAESLLLECGFVRTMPSAHATPKQLQIFNTYVKDRIYWHPVDETILELHWRLVVVDHPFNPPLAYLLAEGSAMTVHGEKISTISGSHLWLYQCLHGSISGWYRMRWVCDIAMLLRFQQPNWPELFELADQYQCRNCLIEAVGLACALYELPIPDMVQLSLKHNRRVQRNIERSARHLFRMHSTCGDFMTLARFFSLCAPNSSLLKFILFRCLLPVDDLRKVQLPEKFFFLYYLLRPFSFLFRYIISEKSSNRNK